MLKINKHTKSSVVADAKVAIRWLFEQYGVEVDHITIQLTYKGMYITVDVAIYYTFQLHYKMTEDAVHELDLYVQTINFDFLRDLETYKSNQWELKRFLNLIDTGHLPTLVHTLNQTMSHDRNN